MPRGIDLSDEVVVDTKFVLRTLESVIDLVKSNGADRLYWEGYQDAYAEVLGESVKQRPLCLHPEYAIQLRLLRMEQQVDDMLEGGTDAN